MSWWTIVVLVTFTTLTYLCGYARGYMHASGYTRNTADHLLKVYRAILRDTVETPRVPISESRSVQLITSRALYDWERAGDERD